jgi:hypothetical protein
MTKLMGKVLTGLHSHEVDGGAKKAMNTGPAFGAS